MVDENQWSRKAGQIGCGQVKKSRRQRKLSITGEIAIEMKMKMNSEIWHS